MKKYLFLPLLFLQSQSLHAALTTLFKDEAGETNWQYVANWSSVSGKKWEATLSNKIVTLEINLEPSDNRRLASLCGPFDDNIKHLERRLRRPLEPGPFPIDASREKVQRDLHVNSKP